MPSKILMTFVTSVVFCKITFFHSYLWGWFPLYQKDCSSLTDISDRLNEYSLCDTKQITKQILIFCPLNKRVILFHIFFLSHTGF